MRLPWFEALAATTLRAGERAGIALLEDEQQARAALVLAIDGRRIARALTAPYTSIFSVAAQSPADAKALGARLAQLGAGAMMLDCLDENAPANAALLDGLACSGFISARYRHFANWRERTGDFSAYWQRRPGPLRETVRRKTRRASQRGAEFLCLAAPDEIAAGIAEYEALYRVCGKVPEPHPAFMAQMMRNLAPEGSVRLGLMRMEGQTVAAQIWLVRSGRATIFKLAHRPDMASLSPGTLLTHWMFSTLLPGDQIIDVDFGRGNDRYKRDWLSDCVFRTGVIACNPAKLSGLRHIATDILPTWTGRLLRRQDVPSP
jgi:hypothetical protein